MSEVPKLHRRRCRFRRQAWADFAYVASGGPLVEPPVETLGSHGGHRRSPSSGTTYGAVVQPRNTLTPALPASTSAWLCSSSHQPTIPRTRVVSGHVIAGLARSPRADARLSPCVTGCDRRGYGGTLMDECQRNRHSVTFPAHLMTWHRRRIRRAITRRKWSGGAAEQPRPELSPADRRLRMALLRGLA